MVLKLVINVAGSKVEGSKLIKYQKWVFAADLP